MSRFLACLSAAILFVSVASAQERGDGGERRGGDGRGGEGRGGFRGGMMGGRGGAEFFERQWQRIAEDLDLDEAQRQQYDQLVKSHNERMRQMGERWAEVREAQDAGDDERARQIRQQLERGMMRPGDAVGEILDEMEPTLRPEQVEKAEGIRERMQGDANTFDAMRRIARDLPEALKLDEPQKAQFEELLQTSREEMRSRMSNMGPMMQQMREAREAGDMAKVRELEKEMEAQRPDANAMNARYAEFFGKVEGMLRDDQKPLLESFREDLGLGAEGDASKAGSSDVRGILQAAKRLRLNAEQKKELKEIEDDATKAWKEAGRDKQARAELAGQVREEIAKMLDETQAERFAQLLERADRRASGKR